MSLITAAGLKVRIHSALYRWYRRNKKRLFGWHKKSAKPIAMFDDITPSLIPVSAEAVAGYVDGKWPTYAQLVKQFPHAKHHLSIAVFASDSADVLDVEPGDALISQAPAWVRKERELGNPRPDIYTAVSWAQKLVDTMTVAGLRYGIDYRLWSAHYTYKPHLCSPACGFGFREIAHATQWTDKAGGKSLDESICQASFFS